MSADLYAEVARDMMRFGIGDTNNTSIVLDLSNEYSGVLGSKTTTPDGRGGIAKAVVRLYAGADLATAAHEIAHLGWINLSDQDRATFSNWAIETEEQFVAQVLGMKYDDNFRGYLLEALTNKGVGGSLDSRGLWAAIQSQGATRQTIDILNGHRNPKNMADAIDERFAWEFSNWFVQGYARGAEPHNVIERILQRACQSLGGALNLLIDTDRYLNNKETGYNGGEVNEIFKRMSATKKDFGQVQQAQPVQAQAEPVSIRTEMTQPIMEAPYNLGQGFNEAEHTSLDSNPTQNIARNTGTIGSQVQTVQPVQSKPTQDIDKNLGTVPKLLPTEAEEGKKTTITNYGTQGYQGETLEQYRERIKKEQEE